MIAEQNVRRGRAASGGKTNRSELENRRFNKDGGSSTRTKENHWDAVERAPVNLA